MKVKPRRGHVYVMPLEEEIRCAKDSALIRHPDYVPICQDAVVMAIGAPLERRKYINGKWRTITDRAEVRAGDKIHFPFKSAKKDLGHELAVNGVLMRVLSFDQIKNCVVYEDTEATAQCQN